MVLLANAYSRCAGGMDTIWREPVGCAYHEKQLRFAYQNTQYINLEENPGKLSKTQQAPAYAVFRTIAEKHGNEAVTKLLAAFWKLKPAQRTSRAFGKICEKHLKQPLAAYLPRGIVIEPVAEKLKK